MKMGMEMDYYYYISFGVCSLVAMTLYGSFVSSFSRLAIW